MELPASGVRAQTLAHAKAIGAVEHAAPKRTVKTLVTEMDGSMLPIVETKTGPGLDGRRAINDCSGRARLCCARPADVVDRVYGATFGTAPMAGLLWHQVAAPPVWGLRLVFTAWVMARLGFSTPLRNNLARAKTRARRPLVVSSCQRLLGAMALAPKRNKDWLHEQQELLRHNQVTQVLETLQPKLRTSWNIKEAPIHAPTPPSPNGDPTWIIRAHIRRRDCPSAPARWKAVLACPAEATQDRRSVVAAASCRKNASTPNRSRQWRLEHILDRRSQKLTDTFNHTREEIERHIRRVSCKRQWHSRNAKRSSKHVAFQLNGYSFSAGVCC